MRLVLKTSNYTTRAGVKHGKGEAFSVPESEGSYLVKVGKAEPASAAAAKPLVYRTRRLKAED
jgi:hypothetical protein